LREDWEYNIGQPLKITGDLKSFFSWFAFEEIAYQMMQSFEELGLE
jgi:hypothetical protein